MMESNEEFSLKQIISSTKHWIKRILTKRFWILGVSVITMVLMIYKESRKHTTYSCHVTFMVAEDDGASSSGLVSLLGNFGMGPSKLGGYNLAKLGEIAFSSTVLNKTLLDTVNYKGEPVILANRIIDVHEVHKDWVKDKDLNNYYINGKTLVAKDSLDKEKRAMHYLRGLYKGGKTEVGLATFQSDIETGICQLSVRTRDDKLSLALVNAHFKRLEDFYSSMSLQAKQRSVKIVQNKEDSVRHKLAETEARLAYIQDRNKGIVLKSDRIEINQLNRKLLILNTLLSEVVKNKETAQFLLDSESSFLHVIDSPTLPAYRKTPKIISRSVIGFVIGLTLSTIFVFIGLWLKDQMAEE